MFSNSDHEVTNLVQTNLPLSLLITTQTHADERNDEQQILSKDKIKYFIKNTSHLKICLFLSIFVAACVGPQSRHKGIVWCEGRTGEFLWSSWPLPHPSQGRHALRCTDGLLAELLFIKTCCVKAENFQDAADKKQHKVAESSWQCWWSVARPIIPESGAGWQ